ncbi:MAG TPA: phosphate/phosphite/phosphonate ABC transporter substrate-binding protein [Desulfurivibrio alkaliphilus]|uniref:Phosphate/phosphite/phosphonate ABC transporter substrate-binding protein n=1 Tax=Desulfurivibrio alkaliphilus TaxID=427923 RepID=A0A7C2X9W2_9BACT|nr:phosphate/phosphite/phosphonate ABC transporter substrate-binding protein [Desulfurivibrio alkaliphilus]
MPGKPFIFLLIWCWLGTGIALADGPLTLWIHPYLPATELTSRFLPLTQYLSRELDRPVEVRVQRSYQAHLEMTGRDLADIAYLGPAIYVNLTRQYGPKPLLAKLEIEGTAHFHGMIIARTDAPIQTLSDLRGKSFAFGDLNSTMSHVVPRAMLKAAGVDLHDLAHHDFLGSHHDVALAVLGGYFDAGAVKQEVYAIYQPRGLKIVAQTPEIPNHLFLTRKDLSPELVTRLRQALLAINQLPDKDALLTTLEDSATGLLPVADADYDDLRRVITEAVP